MCLAHEACHSHSLTDSIFYCIYRLFRAINVVTDSCIKNKCDTIRLTIFSLRTDECVCVCVCVFCRAAGAGGVL